MPLPSSINDLSQTAGSNSPSGSEAPSLIDDYLRTYASYIAQHRDGKGFALEASVASAATCDIGAANSLIVQITGTTGITSFGTTYSGPRIVRFAAALTLTHSATLVLPGAANITTAAGDALIAVPNGNPGSGYRVVAFQRSASLPSLQGPITSSGLTMNTGTVLGRLTAGVGGVEELTPAQLRALISLVHGQCRLALDGSNLRLSPYNGNQLLINGTPQSVPAAGVALAPTSLAASTTYFIYAYMVGATMTLEASTTGHSTDATTGVEIKTGDATRTLVGMARTTAGVAWVDSVTDRLVLSWFNRSAKDMLLSITAGTTTSATMVEINTANRLNFLAWPDEAVRFNASLYTTSSSSGSTWATRLSTDNTGFYGYGQFTGGTTITNYQFAPAINARVPEGFHFASVQGQNSGGATLTLNGGGTSSISGSVQG